MFHLFNYKYLLQNIHLDRKKLKKWKKRKLEKQIESQEASIVNFVINIRQDTTKNFRKNITNEQKFIEKI